MNILYTSELGNFGGGETSLYNIMYKFQKDKSYNIKPFFMCCEDGDLVSKCLENGINTEVFDYYTAFKSGNILKMIDILKFIKKYILLNNIEIIQCNSYQALIILGLGMKIFNIKVKLTWLAHGSWYKFNLIKRTLINSFASKIFAVSMKVKENLKDNSINIKLIEKKHLGIDTSKFKNGEKLNLKQQLNISEECLIIGTIGRFQEIKGQDLLVETMRELKKDGMKVKAVLVGDAIFGNKKDQDFKNRIIGLIKKYNLQEDIFLLGKRSDIENILHSIDVLIIPSINESFGMVAIEAIAAGCPVISTPCDGVKEIIWNKNLGVILKERNINEMKKEIKNFINLKDNVEIMKRAGFKEAEKYDINNVCRSLLDEYRKLI